MRLYQHTTAPEELTGDGLAAAFRVGAALLTDMEFPMFLPYVLICPPIMDGVDWTYNVSAYLEAFAFNRRGERYMAKWDPERLERTTRDVNSVAAMIEVLDGLVARMVVRTYHLLTFRVMCSTSRCGNGSPIALPTISTGALICINSAT